MLAASEQQGQTCQIEGEKHDRCITAHPVDRCRSAVNVRKNLPE